MVAYTKEEEDFIFDVWKSVRKHDKENGVLDSSSNRQRYIKVYQAYKSQGFTRTYSQIETKLKKHRATFIKVYVEGSLSPNAASCPRYADLLEMFGEVYQPGVMPVGGLGSIAGGHHTDLDIKHDKSLALSFIDMNEAKTSVADMLMNSQSHVSVHEIDNLTDSPLSYLAFNGSTKSFEQSPLIHQNSLQKMKPINKNRSRRSGGFKRNRDLLHPYDPLVVLNPTGGSASVAPIIGVSPQSAYVSTAPLHQSTPLHHSLSHAPAKITVPSAAATSCQRQHQATMKLLRGIRDDSKQHALTLNASVQTLATAILRLVEHDRSSEKPTTDFDEIATGDDCNRRVVKTRTDATDSGSPPQPPAGVSRREDLMTTLPSHGAVPPRSEMTTPPPHAVMTTPPPVEMTTPPHTPMFSPPSPPDIDAEVGAIVGSTDGNGEFGAVVTGQTGLLCGHSISNQL